MGVEEEEEENAEDIESKEEQLKRLRNKMSQPTLRQSRSKY